ncbi:MAG: hypothetical protein PHE25_03480 [Candidatus Gracilibacteria bacterium]|nr:hypothetical protein [Candidatus Gracilibacteria bacterium]
MKTKLLKGFVFGISFTVGIIIGYFVLFAALDWSSINTNVNTETPLTPTLWNNTMSGIISNVNKAENIGVVFTRWGKKTCPINATLVYEGITAGSHNGHGGGGANALCLSKTPSWLDYNDGNQDGALIYGAEYEVSSGQIPSLTSLQNYEVPCAVCLDTRYSIQFMYPGQTTCPSSWNIEYAGYLMSKHYTQSKGEFICVDQNAEAIGSNADNDGYLLYPTEYELGSLTSPYIQNREATCAICTK